MQMRGAMLYVKDLERMRLFYGDLLGTSPTNQNYTDTWAAFDSGSVRFALHAIPTGIAAGIEIASPAVPRETEPVKLLFEVEDVEGMRAKLEALGAQTIRRPWQEPGVACDVVDPEGNILQICSS
jgi:predicted enzyme related to lactoylglutathione lyase